MALDDEELSLLLVDFEYLQKAIDKFDAHRFQIRGWTITTAGAILAVAYGAQRPIVVVGGIVTTLFFGFLEVIYTAIQADVITRSNEIEALINHRRTGNRVAEPKYSFGISQAFARTIVFAEVPRLIFSKGRIHITFFYFGLLLVMVVSSIAALTP